MSEQNHIDELFRSKLAGGEAGGYSEAAWSKASSMLDSHFRWLFLKKLLIIGLPVILLLAGTGAWFLAGDDHLSLGSDRSGVKTHSEDIKAESSRSAHTATDVSIQEIVDQQGSYEVADTETPGHGAMDNAKLHTSPKEGIVAADQPTPNKGQSMALTASRTDSELASQPGNPNKLASTPSGESTLDDNAPSVGANLARTASSNAADQSHTASELETLLANTMRTMPTFSLGRLKTAEAAHITERSALERNVLQANKRIELHAGGGVVLGSKIPMLADRAQGMGAHGLIEAQVHFDQGIFASTGIVYHTRSMAIDNRAVLLNGSLYRPTSIRYLDIPLKVGYRLGARHRIAFGMVFSPRIGVASEKFSPALWTEPMVVVAAQSVREGFANYDVAGTLEYRVQLSNRVFSHAAFRYGLFDVTDDDFFETGDQDDRNHQFRIGLSYRLLNH